MDIAQLKTLQMGLPLETFHYVFTLLMKSIETQMVFISFLLNGFDKSLRNEYLQHNYLMK